MKKKRTISKSFIGFLCVSILIWILITMSKEYVTTVEIPILYKGIPQNLLLQKEPVKNLNITIKASGFKTTMLKLRQKVVNLNLKSLSKKNETTYYILTRNYFSKIKNQLINGVTLQQIEVDTLFLSLGILKSKKIPVKADYKISYQIGYDLSGEINVSPDSILVSGPENQINQLKKITVKPFELYEVKEDFSKKVNIDTPEKLSNLRFDKTEVTITGKVEKFTEGNLNVNFEIINVPKEIEITTLLKSVNLTFVVSLSDFGKINQNSFEIQCDYKMSAANNLTYLVPKIIRKPAEVKNIRIVPNQIDFLIQK